MSDEYQTIHRYEIVRILGRGGMGELYLARDPILDRYVAIKVLRSGFDGDDVRARFAREARAAARLAHVNIVTVFDVGEHDGKPYIAMEYVHGETLSDKIRSHSSALTLATKLQYIDELCAGLAHAHRAGIVHRDIKPANLIVASDGPLKILDFGIARVADSSMTQAGMMIGTLNYMSPEQITGSQAIDHRSDIFAVGAVCYELLSYQQAFPGTIDTGVLSRIILGTPTPLEQLCPGLDPGTIGIVSRALAKAPEGRFADLVEMRTALARVRERLDGSALASTGGLSSERRSSSSITPIGTPKTPRRPVSREDIQRRRAQELASHLAAARAALAEGGFEEAAAACERALILAENHEEALEISERARQGIERNQVREWMGEARADLARNDLSAARQILSLIVSVDSDSADAASLRAAIELAEARRRADDAVSSGRELLDNGDATEAVAAARDALDADPAHTGAARLLRDAEAVVEERRRKAEHDRLAQEAVGRARQQFADGDLDGAVALLQAFAPSHVTVDAALAELLDERRQIRERELERQRQLSSALVAARASLVNDDIRGAEEALARANAIDAGHQGIPDVANAIEAKREELTRRRVEEVARRKAAEEEARRKAAEEEARRRVAEEEAAKRRADEQEARRRRAEEDVRRRATEEARRHVELATAPAAAEIPAAARTASAAKTLVDEQTIIDSPVARTGGVPSGSGSLNWQALREEMQRKAAERARQRTQEETSSPAVAGAEPPNGEREAAGDQNSTVSIDRAIAPDVVASPRISEPAATEPVTVAPPPIAKLAAMEQVAVAPPSIVQPLMTPPASPRTGASPRQLLSLAAAALLVLALIGFTVLRSTSGVETVSAADPRPAAEAAVPATPSSSPSAAVSSPTSPMPGLLVIDAIPWAEVVEIIGPVGALSLPAHHTPMAFDVPAGEYRITLRTPGAAQPRVLTATVESGGSARAFLASSPVDVDDYFRRAGS
jgi:serine/threonine protein kinase